MEQAERRVPQGQPQEIQLRVREGSGIRHEAKNTYTSISLGEATVSTPATSGKALPLSFDVLHVVDPFGRFQKKYALLIMSLTWFFCGAHTITMLFSTQTPPRFPVCDLSQSNITYSTPWLNAVPVLPPAVTVDVLEKALEVPCEFPLQRLPEDDCVTPYMYAYKDASVVSSFNVPPPLCALREGSPVILSGAAWTNSAFFFGFLLGAPLLGQFGDWRGRRAALLTGITIMQIAAFLAAFSSTLLQYGVGRCFVGFGVGGAGLSSFILMAEITGSQHRTSITLIHSCAFAVGAVYSSGLATLFSNWRALLLAVCCPGMAIYLPFCFSAVNVESPRWLALRGKGEDALSTWKAIAKLNRRAFPAALSAAFLVSQARNVPQNEGADTARSRQHSVDADGLELRLKSQRSWRESTEDERRLQSHRDSLDKESEETLKHPTSSTKDSCLRIFSSPPLRLRFFVCWLLWFSASLMYYGVYLDQGYLMRTMKMQKVSPPSLGMNGGGKGGGGGAGESHVVVPSLLGEEKVYAINETDVIMVTVVAAGGGGGSVSGEATRSKANEGQRGLKEPFADQVAGFSESPLGGRGRRSLEHVTTAEKASFLAAGESITIEEDLSSNLLREGTSAEDAWSSGVTGRVTESTSLGPTNVVIGQKEPWEGLAGSKVPEILTTGPIERTVLHNEEAVTERIDELVLGTVGTPAAAQSQFEQKSELGRDGWPLSASYSEKSSRIQASPEKVASSPNSLETNSREGRLDQTPLAETVENPDETGVASIIQATSSLVTEQRGRGREEEVMVQNLGNPVLDRIGAPGFGLGRQKDEANQFSLGSTSASSQLDKWLLGKTLGALTAGLTLGEIEEKTKAVGTVAKFHRWFPQFNKNDITAPFWIGLRKVALTSLVSFACEIPAAAISSFLASRAACGRKGVILTAFGLSSVMCLAAFMMQVRAVPLGHLPVYAVALTANAARLVTAGSFLLLYPYCSELFPTSVRSAVLGSLSMGARVAGILVPLVIQFVQRLFSGSALFIFGICTLISSLIGCATLPETFGKNMPATIGSVQEEYLASLTADNKRKGRTRGLWCFMRRARDGEDETVPLNVTTHRVEEVELTGLEGTVAPGRSRGTYASRAGDAGEGDTDMESQKRAGYDKNTHLPSSIGALPREGNDEGTPASNRHPYNPFTPTEDPLN